MEMEVKKISFGFTKVKKAVKPVEEEKKDFIECLEGKAIKLKGGEEAVEISPLVIEMQPNTMVTAAERLKKIADEVEKCMDIPEPGTIKTEPEDHEIEASGNETLDQLAVKELLKESKKEIKVETEELTVPVLDKSNLGGSKESTLEDYESIPIQEFGKAMLRGMGWKPGKEQAKLKELQVRPKGLGLGADKMIKKNQEKQPTTKDGDKELMMVKNAFVHVTSGKYSGCYGKVVSLDEDNGRVMVDIPLRKETVNLSEFMMHPVTKAEYDKQSKVINADKYEEYKKKESSRAQETNGNDRPSRDGNKNESRERRRDDKREERKEHDRKDREEKSGGREKERSKYRDEQKSERSRGHNSRRDEKDDERRDNERRNDKRDKIDTKSKHKKRSSSTSSEDKDRSKKKESKKRYSSESSEDDRGRKRKSTDSSSSDDSFEHRKSKKSKKKHDEKRDIDKKRKGKKKKRDRDRSPYYKKCRK